MSIQEKLDRLNDTLADLQHSVEELFKRVECLEQTIFANPNEMAASPSAPRDGHDGEERPHGRWLMNTTKPSPMPRYGAW